jgi:LPXTG-motif cell wall-anchored protein
MSAILAARWQGRREFRADLRAAMAVVVGLALAGLPVGLLWWLLAPRADYRITADGPVALGNPTEELFVADDSVFVLVLAGFGLLAGVAVWWLRRRRGVTILLALAVGMVLTGVVAWQLGELLGAGPSQADLADVGRTVTTSLTMGSLPALALGPFTAVAVYLVGVLYVADDGLDRTPDPAVPQAYLPPTDEPDNRPMVEVPPPGS